MRQALSSKTFGLRTHVRALALLASLTAVAAAQTPIKAPPNKYAPADDVKLGQQAAAQVRQQMPILGNEEIDSFVDRIGRRLVSAVPPEFQHPEFRYDFSVVNASDINAFALPGGPMFVNRGMIAAARTEGEVAGVMAHELSHVVLRHGTAQASKAQKYQIGEIAGQVLGAIVGGTAGAVIAQGSQFGLGAAFLRFSREYEREADILGAQIMARAGYDPMQMANMFETIQKQGGSRGPEWLSDHPDPGNRRQAIEREARMLQVSNAAGNSGDLRTVQAALQRMPPAQSSEQIARRAEAGGANTGAVGTSGTISANVEPPSQEFRTYTVGGVFQVSVPDNWQQIPAGDTSVRFSPQGASGTVSGQQVFTHGIEFGVGGNDTPDLAEATQSLVSAFRQTNPGIQAEGQARRVSFGGRDGLQVTLRNTSEATGRDERVLVTTTLLSDNNLFYSVGVAPASEFGRYQQALAHVNGSVRLER